MNSHFSWFSLSRSHHQVATLSLVADSYPGFTARWTLNIDLKDMIDVFYVEVLGTHGFNDTTSDFMISFPYKHAATPEVTEMEIRVRHSEMGKWVYAHADLVKCDFLPLEGCSDIPECQACSLGFCRPAGMVCPTPAKPVTLIVDAAVTTADVFWYGVTYPNAEFILTLPAIGLNETLPANTTSFFIEGLTENTEYSVSLAVQVEDSVSPIKTTVFSTSVGLSNVFFPFFPFFPPPLFF